MERKSERGAETGSITFGTRTPGRGILPLFLAVFLVLVLSFALLVGVLPARAYNADPNPGPVEPNPELEGNVTFATHLSGWTTLQYTTNAGGVANLTATVDSRVVNPVSVNPTDVVASGQIQQEKVPSASTTAYWNSTTYFSKQVDTACMGTDTGPTLATVNGISVVQATQNTTNCGSGYNNNLLSSPAIPISLYPSANPAFDYVTAIYGISGPACATGVGNCYLVAGIINASAGGSNGENYPAYTAKTGIATAGGAVAQDELGPGAIGYFSESLAQLSNAHAGFNTTTGTSYSTSFQVLFQLVLPKTATAGTYTITVYAFGISTQPFTFGTTTWGAGANAALMTRNVAFTNLNLTTFAPSQSYQSIAGGGFTVATTEQATALPDPTDVSTQIAAISVNNATSGGPPYVEQVTYQFTFVLPTAAAVTYSGFKLADFLGISGVQYVSVTFGGTAYTTTYQAYPPHAWESVATGVNPAVATTWIGIVDFTGPQWDSISSPPGIFSANGIAYWWYVFLGAILAVAGASSGWVASNKRALSSRRGVGRVPFSGLVGPRSLRNNRMGWSGRHTAAVTVGLIFVGAGLIGAYSIWIGADVAGATAAFTGGLIILFAIVAIAFIAYEVAHHYRMRHHRG